MSDYTYRGRIAWADAEKKLRETFKRWNVHRYAIEPNTNSRNLNSRYLVGEERSVTVRYWKSPRGEREEREVVLSLGTQDSPALNLRAIGLTLEDMRMIEVRGTGEVAAAAYLQLEGPREPVERDPWEVLGLRPDAAPELIEAAYRALAKSRHPDGGGTAEAFQELQRAYERVKVERTPA